MTFVEQNDAWMSRLSHSAAQARLSVAHAQARAFLDSFGALMFETLPLPLVIDPQDFENLCVAGRLLMRAQAKIAAGMLSTSSKPELLQLFKLKPSMEGLVDWEELVDPDRYIARYDILPGREGFKFCEINVDSSLGGFKVAEALQRQNETFGWGLKQRQESPVGHLAAALGRMAEELGAERLVIFTLKAYLEDDSGTLQYLQSRLSRLLPALQVSLVDETSYPESLMPPAVGKRTLVYRFAVHADMESDDILRRIYDSGARVVCSHACEIQSSKLWFALMHEPRFQRLLGPEEIDNIRRYVPYSLRLSEIDLDPILETKSRWVFKSINSYGGADVLIGADVDLGALRRRLTDTSDWIAQELVTGNTVMLPQDFPLSPSPHHVVLGIYHVYGQDCGAMVRASALSRVVNVSSGKAKVGWAYPLNPDELERLEKECR